MLFRVIGQPEITVAPLDHKLPTNSRVTWYCEVSGHPAPKVFWMKDNRKLNERRNRYIVDIPYGSALTLESVTSRQAGAYECVADNGIGDVARANATLSVYEDGQGGYCCINSARINKH